jgi:hypothetical protein
MLLLTLSNHSVLRDTLFKVASHYAERQKNIWFHYAKIDSLYNNHRYHYFIFSNGKQSLIRRDSTLYLLKDTKSLPDDETSQLGKEKVYIPYSAFPFILKKDCNYTVFRIDTVENNLGRNSYKLKRLFTQ